ncbi:hypothetical protein CCAX7_53790 [Capsulimonas corticalis]|uniref:Uncharacterized protein n=1 Tax=Capsulimonas corticalis TaxID=2219043 RepID=A0A402CNR6_9BACT|nr:hypothetical protein [Capsulimonas corticalis]BDI33328.1 hypothetical protein CCAX7_53790 [Capsulimonas corticalis]
MSRYDGQPFLRFLDCYVLKAIGHLSAQHETALRQMAPALAKSYGMTGAWEAIVERQMDFPATLPAQIHELWVENVALAKARHIILDPEDFTTQFVDQNFLSEE